MTTRQRRIAFAAIVCATALIASWIYPMHEPVSITLYIITALLICVAPIFTEGNQ